MIVLDTNVISELMRPTPSDTVIAWVSRQIPTDLYLSTITEAEMRYGVESLPAGRRRDGLLAAIEAMFREDFVGRILPFDRAAAQAYAMISVSSRTAGHAVKQADFQIAAIARSTGASVATSNVRDFEDRGINVINPWMDP